jgi:hypothetical protein
MWKTSRFGFHRAKLADTQGIEVSNFHYSRELLAPKTGVDIFAVNVTFASVDG